MNIQKASDIAVITAPNALFERTGDIAIGEAGGCRYEQVGDLHKFSQFAKSKSLRAARVMLKKMRREAFSECP